MHGISDWLLNKFNNWFVSDNGVWQTLIVTAAIVVLERIFPQVDPSGFWLLYILTVYSGITQPALARAGRVSGEHQEEMLARIESLEKKMLAVLTHVQSGSGNTGPTIEKQSPREEQVHG